MTTVQSANSVASSNATLDSSQSHTVAHGETLSSIAQHFGVSVHDLQTANPQIRNPDRIYPGDRLHIPSHEAAPSNKRAPSADAGGSAPAKTPQATTQAGQLPDTKNLSAAQKYEVYSGYVEKFGSAQAKADLAAGKQVVLALRTDTNTQANGGHGTYDDRMVIVDGKSHQASEYKASTDPISRYEGRYGQDVNHDGKVDLGRLADGTYSFYSSTYLGHSALKPNGNEKVERDTNHDGKFDSKDGASRVQTAPGSSIADYVHIGGNTDTGSAGCLTLPPDQHAAFFNKLKSGSDIHLVMVNTSRLGASAPTPEKTGGVAAPTGAGAPAAGAKPEHISEKGIALVKHAEGLYTTAYRDPVGVLTIGYGHTGADVKPGQTISAAQAEKLLKTDMQGAENAVKKYVKVPLSQGQFDALTSFTFNVGEGALKDSTLLRKLNGGDYAGAQKEFGRWVHGDGKVLPGLVTRRADEAALFGNHAPSGQATAPAAKTDGGATSPAKPAAAATNYTVRSGDTLSAIAANHNVGLQALIAANPQIRNPNVIHSGQTVHIPKAGAAAAAAPTPAAPSGNGTHAVASGRNTVITNADGSTETRSGGTLAWRNNNPGNIRSGAWANAHGAIGNGPGGFAVFPDRATGERAVTTLLQSGSYRNLSVANAIARWAPPSENDTGAYQRNVREYTGLDTSRSISDLSAAELSRVATAIGRVEGWQQGTVATQR